MLASAWHATCELANKLRNFPLLILAPCVPESPFTGNRKHDIVPALNFPPIPSRLPELLCLGLESNVALLLHTRFVEASRNIDASLQEIYYTNSPKFCENVSPLMATRSQYIDAFQKVLSQHRCQSIERIWASIVSHTAGPLSDSKPIQPHTPALSPNSDYGRKRKGRPQAFSKEQTVALNALLKHDNQYSSEEKELIAHELDLTREQVNRWFCNARARKKPYYKPPRRSRSSLLESTMSQYSCDSPSSSSEQMDNPGSLSPRSSASDDSSEEMVITTSSSNSSNSSESGGDPMDTYFDFPAYQHSETWAQQFNASTPSSSRSLDLFNFNPLDPSLPSSSSFPSRSNSTGFSWTSLVSY